MKSSEFVASYFEALNTKQVEKQIAYFAEEASVIDVDETFVPETVPPGPRFYSGILMQTIKVCTILFQLLQPLAAVVGLCGMQNNLHLQFPGRFNAA